MNKSGLKALLLLAAALPLVALGNRAVGLAPGQTTLDMTERTLGAVAGATPTVLAQQAPPPEAQAEPAKETRRLEKALTELATADQETLDDLRTFFDEEVDNLEDDLDDLDADLDDRDAELDELGDTNVEGSRQLQAAEDKLRELEEAVRGLRRQLGDIRRQALRAEDPAAFIGQVRALGASIAEIKRADRDELGPLIEAAERNERDDEDEEEEEEPSPEPSPTAEP